MTAPAQSSLTAVALVCSLKPSSAPSSSELMAENVCERLRDADVMTASVRCADYAISPGVQLDMGDGDEWPRIREKLLACAILVSPYPSGGRCPHATPVWLGRPSSITQRVLERLDAELSNTDDAERPVMVGKVALVVVVGNEDGAHKTVADCFQGLNDIGYTFPAQGCAYRNGEAMQSKDYNDLDEVPDAVASATAAAARNAAHLANVLREWQYPHYQ